MKKIYSILCLIGGICLAGVQNSNAQCAVDENVNGIYLFNNPDGVAGGFSGFLCEDVDSVGTAGLTGYFDGDGYAINLVAGTQVTFRVDSCTGSPVSLTMADSLNTIIAGAYSAPACPNTLSFTATYTGNYILVINKNGVCAAGDTVYIGQAYVNVDTGTTVAVCPSQANVINDTICGAVEITIDGAYVSGNNTTASVTDPLDGTVVGLGFDCSTPSNTLWYTFTAPTADTALYIRITSDVGSLFHSWVGAFAATDPTNPCDPSLLAYLGCVEGADDGVGINSAVINFPAVSPGDVYYLMIDGFSGSVGGFSMAVQSSALFNGVSNGPGFKKDFSVYPNPANSSIVVENNGMNGVVNVQLTNSLGEVVISKSFDGFVKETLDVSNQPAGIYSVRVISDNKSYDKKIVIAK